MAESDIRGAERGGAIASRDVELEQLRAELNARTLENQQLRASMSWRLTRPYRVVGRVIRLVVDAGLHPKVALVVVLRVGAKHIRSHAALRAACHRVVRRLPVGFQRKLVALAPPSPQEAGILGPRSEGPRAELLGDAAWIYHRLIKVI